MKFAKVYDSVYSHMIIGYRFDGGIIYKDARTSWSGNEIVEGWEVCVNNKRVFYAGTLKEAKAYVNENFN